MSQLSSHFSHLQKECTPAHSSNPAKDQAQCILFQQAPVVGCFQGNRGPRWVRQDRGLVGLSQTRPGNHATLTKNSTFPKTRCVLSNQILRRPETPKSRDIDPTDLPNRFCQGAVDPVDPGLLHLEMPHRPVLHVQHVRAAARRRVLHQAYQMSLWLANHGPSLPPNR